MQEAGQAQFATLTPLGSTIINQNCSASSLPPIQTISSSRVTGSKIFVEFLEFSLVIGTQNRKWAKIQCSIVRLRSPLAINAAGWVKLFLLSRQLCYLWYQSARRQVFSFLHWILRFEKIEFTKATSSTDQHGGYRSTSPYFCRKLELRYR